MRASNSTVRNIPVARIRPEEGLSRKRDREGHEELCRSIAKFGVLTPITVRPASDGTGDFLLVKGQGRTLACRHLQIRNIPAIVVGRTFSETEKVQQFLVENVARLRMKPVDRALLIAHARASGEETSKIARRFGITPATVRRLEAQIEGASDAELAALRKGEVTLALQAVIARLVASSERHEVVQVVAQFRVSAVDFQTLLLAIGWANLAKLGPQHRATRLRLLKWACGEIAGMPSGSPRSKITRMAKELPTVLAERLSEAVG